ncbi:uncharacterized protein PG998_010258 [Apiospora kogelbergensis]|uniref:uncharacterized protein n=1 Tax=Apiospora kogelbergensis TaxID=1337665 RepID=UPI0031322B73
MPESRDTKATVLSVLCDPELWSWDERPFSSISFSRDGTGTLRAGAELSVFIAVEIEWKLKTSGALDASVDLGHKAKDSSVAQQLSVFDVEITLTRRVHPLLKDHFQDGDLVNEKALTEAAFLPKTFHARLERGRFAEPALSLTKEQPFRGPKYQFRLAFDKSPFPPRKEWMEEGRFAAEQCRFWDCREFVAGEVGKDGFMSALVQKAKGSLANITGS